jgi:glycosyltransferase involved in cell wall biosynthesis
MTESIAKADLLVVPSLAGEVFGMVLAESMLLRIPVLVSDLGAFVEVLGNTGSTFRIGDTSDLARQIAGVLDDTSLSNRMASAARQRILECFSLDRMIEGHAQIYRRLASMRVSSKSAGHDQ